MDQQHLILRLNEHKIPCPRHWVRPIRPFRNETLLQNFVRLFSEYLPPIWGSPLTVSYVAPLNNKTKPYCQWMVFFSHILPVERGLYENLRQHLNENKPRNTNIKLSAESEHDFVVTYSVSCNCKVKDFCVADETNFLVNYNHVDPVKIEYSFAKIKLEPLD